MKYFGWLGRWFGRKIWKVDPNDCSEALKQADWSDLARIHADMCTGKCCLIRHAAGYVVLRSNGEECGCCPDLLTAKKLKQLGCEVLWSWDSQGNVTRRPRNFDDSYGLWERVIADVE